MQLLLIVSLGLAPSLESRVAEAGREQVRRSLEIVRLGYVASGVIEEEEEHLFRWPDPYFIEDSLRQIADRFAEMEPDCPPAADRVRFPQRQEAMAGYQIGGDFLRFLSMQYDFSGPVEQAHYALLIEDTKWRRAVWGDIVDMQINLGTCGRRIHLQRLRARLGRDAYDAGRVPTPLPPAAYEGYWWLIDLPYGEP